MSIVEPQIRAALCRFWFLMQNDGVGTRKEKKDPDDHTLQRQLRQMRRVAEGREPFEHVRHSLSVMMQIARREGSQYRSRDIGDRVESI